MPLKSVHLNASIQLGRDGALSPHSMSFLVYIIMRQDTIFGTAVGILLPELREASCHRTCGLCAATSLAASLFGGGHDAAAARLLDKSASYEHERLASDRKPQSLNVHCVDCALCVYLHVFLRNAH